jgi:N-acetylneuraminic acid mutarotase
LTKWLGCLKNQSATAIDNKIYIFGGSDNTTYFNELYIFDTLSYTWTKPDISGKVPGPRRAHVAVPLGKKVLEN